MSSFEEEDEDQEKISLSRSTNERKIILEDNNIPLNDEDEFYSSSDDFDLELDIKPTNVNKDLEEDKKNLLETETAYLNNSGNFKNSFSRLSTGNLRLEEIINPKYFEILSDSFESVFPLFYLDTEQRKFLQEKIMIKKFPEKSLLYSGIPDLQEDLEFNCYILLEGEIHIYNNKQNFVDLINEITLFGYDGAIFNKRISTVIVDKDSVLGIISKKDFLNLIHPFSQFATYISRNVRYKDKVLDDINIFRDYVLSSINKGSIDKKKLIQLYKSTLPIIHPGANSDKIDINAFLYSLKRLPENIFENYVYVLVNKFPRITHLNKDLVEDLIPRKNLMNSKIRNRFIYKYLNGKLLIVMRDMETDVLDFICNMCIYLIESGKIRKLIYSPILIKELEESKHFDDTIGILNKNGVKFPQDKIDILNEIFGDQLSSKLIHLCLNFQDISISIKKSFLTDKDPVELWTQSLYRAIKKSLGTNLWISQLDDLIVDIYQGSRKNFINAISPHLYLNQEEILKWCKEKKIILKTKKFLSETDKLIAYSYYYYKNNEEKRKEMIEFNLKYGIETYEKTYGTSVTFIIINVNKLCENGLLSEKLGFKLKASSKNHIIIHIGNTFGSQSHDLIKPIIMMLGKKIRSMNILGKCGGLIGKKGDLMISTKQFLDKTHDVVSNNLGNINYDKLKNMVKTNIHEGAFLTVTGTILQNDFLLNYYKIIMGCIGVEMQGYYFNREFENSIKHMLVKENFIMRCFYYVINLPNENKKYEKEKSEHFIEEGIGVLNETQKFLVMENLT
jgi:hypothetical protein